MKTISLNQLNHESLYEDYIYEYENEFAAYKISFIPDSEMRTKCGIHCHVDQLQEAVKKELDDIISPETIDLFDTSAIVYDVSEVFGTVFFFSSYTVKIYLSELKHGYPSGKKDEIELPFFDIKESKRIIKGFNAFR